MMIAIHTQYKENYGDENQPYWKYKGGSTIIVEGVNLPMNDTIGTVAMGIVDRLRSKVEYSNPMAEEYIIDWEIVSDDYQSEDERLQMEFDGKVTYPDTRINLSTVAA